MGAFQTRSGLKFTIVILIDDTLLSTEIFDRRFCCDLKACKGACCVEGESGAPLEEEEIGEVEKAFEVIKDRLKPESLAVIEREGLYTVDSDGDFVTPIVKGKECVYATFDADGTAKCAFEQAHLEGKLEPFYLKCKRCEGPAALSHVANQAQRTKGNKIVVCRWNPLLKTPSPIPHPDPRLFIWARHVADGF